MQTFLPYPNFTESAQALDYRRLGKQRVEAKQILNALLSEGSGWANHPATLMWQGHERYLALYGAECCRVWVGRGYTDNLLPWFEQRLSSVVNGTPPPWLGWQRFHDSHKSNLLRKDPEFYGQYDWQVPSDLPYVWPTKENRHDTT